MAVLDAGLTYVFGGYKPPNMHRWGPGVRDIYALHYIVSGKGLLITNNESFSIEAGESFMIFPHQEVYYYPDQEEPWGYIWVEFKGEEVEGLLTMIDIAEDRPVVPKLPVDPASFFSSGWHTDMKPHERVRAAAGVRHLLSLYMEHYPRLKETAADDYVAVAKAYIEGNYWRPSLEVSEIVRAVRIDRSHLYRLFKEETGMSVSSYLTDYRIRRACQLLGQTGLSVKTVSYSVGYKDQLYFSKVFKKKRCCTPSDFILSKEASHEA